MKGDYIVRDMNTATEVGWCHHCGTLQLMRDAPWLPVPYIYEHDRPVPCCAECRESEPWEFGVWELPYAEGDPDLRECAAARHVTWRPDMCEECAAEECSP